MKKYLTIGEAAQRLNLQVDTVRRLERNGTLTAERTDGKHRRFRAEIIERYARTREAAPTRPRGKALPPKDRAPRVEPAPSRPRRKRIGVDASPELDEWESFDSSEPPQTDINQLAVAPPPDQPPSANFNRTRDEEIKRLQAIKNVGIRAIPFVVPPTWRARIVADLERFVTGRQFPSYLSLFEAGNIVRARVEEVLEPYRAELARHAQERAEKTTAESRLDALKAHGRRYVVDETSEWEWAEASEARKDVERALDSEVEADWSEHDVEDLADEILDEFEEDEEEEEEDDDDERDSYDEN
ncbi:MAG: excisionase family DNA-binding protein [Gemmatimonadales bacterium]|nr:excisionase family DNA-binding protein [Gemmatimonadales bacterium]